MRSIVPTLVISLFASIVVAAQDQTVLPGSPQFDVVSIKRRPDAVGGGIRSLPDGTMIVPVFVVDHIERPSDN